MFPESCMKNYFFTPIWSVKIQAVCYEPAGRNLFFTIPIAFTLALFNMKNMKYASMPHR
jgi:hypothetical protein